MSGGGVSNARLLQRDAGVGRVLSLAALHHANPEAKAAYRETFGARPVAMGEGVAGTVAETGVSALVSGAALEELLAAEPPERQALYRRFPTHSAVVVPLRARDRIIGTLAATRHESSGPPLTAEDQSLLEDLADRVALALAHAQQHQELLAERQRIDAVLRQMPSAVAIVEAPSGKLVMSNEQNEVIFRLRNEALQGIEQYRRYHGLHPDGRVLEPHEWPLSRSLATGEVVRGEETHIVRVTAPTGSSARTRPPSGTNEARSSPGW